jgi:hypothetical protein
VPVSMNPDDFTQGGLLNNVDVRVVAARWERFDYQGKSNEVPAMRFDLLPLDGSSQETAQWWSAGDLKDFEPSEDAMTLEPVSTDSPSGIRNNTNWAIFLKELVNLGVAKARLSSGRADLFVGMEMHVTRKKIEDKDKGSGGTMERKDTLVPTRIIKLPWESKATGARTAPAAAAGARPPAEKQTVTPADVGTVPAPAAAAGTPVVLDDTVKAAVTEAVKAFKGENKVVSLAAMKKAIFPKLKVAAALKRDAIKALDDSEYMDSIGLTVIGDEVGEYDPATGDLVR